MFQANDPPQQQWSVHAEFTISHPGMDDPENQPQTHTEQGDNGVRMTYSWSSSTANNNNHQQPQSNPWSSSNSMRSTQSLNETSNNNRAYNFQKGNLLFTSIPPKRSSNLPQQATESLNRLTIQDSGYGSDLLSPNSGINQGLLMRRPIRPYNHKCRSTCNIVLSTNFLDENRIAQDDCKNSGKTDSVSGSVQCGRTQSLRCQTPSLRTQQQEQNVNFYGCGDPWCHHSDDYYGRISPVLEMCEENEQQSTLTGNNLKRDVSVQTFEMIDKCTSPFLKYDNVKKSYGKKYTSRRKTEPIFQRCNTPSSITPDSLDNEKIQHRRTNSLPKKTIQSKIAKESAAESSSSSTKKPRTVHIDVYCTGTEMESSSSSNESTENETASTPQTVFESNKVRITHRRANSDQLPFNIIPNIQKSKSGDLIPKKQVESDDETVSSGYPSKLSSYSTLRDNSMSISSVPKSWTTMSSSSCAVPDDYDSIANTSWKDTFSDIENLLQSRSSISGPNESFDFIPRQINRNPIDETPEFENKSVLDSLTTSSKDLGTSDSFEYANFEDRLRIKKMEELWKSKQKEKEWKSPQLTRRHLMQQQKIQEYLSKKINDKELPKWALQDSEDSDSDGSGKAWTIVKNQEEVAIPTAPSSVSSNASRSPSVLALQQRFSLDPSLRAPFTVVPGIYTEPRAIAKKFGSILPVVRKPGHHIGPVKNPDCLCDHCQRYYATVGYNQRGRTRSVGDPSSYQVNWKDFERNNFNESNYPTTKSNSNRSVPL